MLLSSRRSILAQAALLLVLTIFIKPSFGYDVESEAEYEGNGEHDEERQSKPDYSSYFNKGDSSAPFVAAPAQNVPITAGLAPVKSAPLASGFSASEFNSFFHSPHFGFDETASASKQVLQPAPLASAANKPTLASGFVPSNFQAGFGNPVDPFSKDYFEQSAVKVQQQEQQKKAQQEEEESETRPGPNYVSYRVPAPSETLKTYASEVRDLNGQSDYDRPSSEHYTDDNESLEEADREELSEDKKNQPEGQKPAKYSKDDDETSTFEASDAKKKQEATPYQPNYYTKYTQAANPTLSPYQKFSFQPTGDAFGSSFAPSQLLASLQSTPAPFNPTYGKITAESAVENKYETQPTKNNVVKSSGGKRCRKINKDVTEKDIRSGRFKREAMNCYVCEDPKSGANYEQCSYSSEPKNESYFVGKAERYSKPIDEETYRRKRDTKRQSKNKKESQSESEEGAEEYVNPYDYVKQRSHKYYSTPEEFSENYYNKKDTEFPSEQYRFPKEYFQEEEGEDKEKSESEIQSEQIAKDGENCKKIKKKTMTCMVCTNPKTGGNYEQCSYTSAPAEKKYAYVRERKYDENDNPVEDKVVESSEPEEVVEQHKPVNKRRNSKARNIEKDSSSEDDEQNHKRSRSSSRRPSKYQYQNQKKRVNDEESAEETQKKPVRKEADDEEYEIPSHFEKSTLKRQKSGLTGLDPELFGSPDSSYEYKDKKANFQKEIEDYHQRIYPKRNEESETKHEEQRLKPADYDEKKDVEAVLAEFAKKDRSKCKKSQRNGMTCYLCVDKNGMKNEECMFVSESQPKSSHIAYHETKKIKSPEREQEADEADDEAETQHKEVKERKREESNLKKRRPQKFTNPSKSQSSESDDNSGESTNLRTTPSFRIRSTTSAPVVASASSTSSTKARIPRKIGRDKNISRDIDALINEGEGDFSSKVKRQVVNKNKNKKNRQDEVESEPLDKDIELVALETSPVFSKAHGVTLPKYMVQVSDYEKIFDTDNHPNH